MGQGILEKAITRRRGIDERGNVGWRTLQSCRRLHGVVLDSGCTCAFDEDGHMCLYFSNTYKKSSVPPRAVAIRERVCDITWMGLTT